MRLSPLQSRLAASLLASCLLIVLYLILFSPRFALAIDLNQAMHEDDYDLFVADPPDELEVAEAMYEPEFAPFGRSIIGRAQEDITELSNTKASQHNLEAGTTHNFVFTRSGKTKRDSKGDIATEGEMAEETAQALEGPQVGREDATMGEEHTGLELRQDLAPRQATTMKKVFISANTCMQPRPVSPDKTTIDPPQLTLYVSSTVKKPGPTEDFAKQKVMILEEGAAMFNWTASGNVFIGVSAPNVSSDFSGIYNFEVAASTDGWYHSYSEVDDSELYWVDSDAASALLVSRNLTDDKGNGQEALQVEAPYVMFAQNERDHSLNGLRYSYCGLSNNAQIAGTKDGRGMVTTRVTRRGPGEEAKQQFYFSGLNASSSYYGILAIDGSSAAPQAGMAPGGRKVFRATPFTTKDTSNCALLVNLPFCDRVEYAVPTNPGKFNSTQLAAFYDNYAETMYGNFDKAMQQIQCEANSTNRYSLVKNCSDCAQAYKDWLCFVTIPRCEDVNSTRKNLVLRNTNQPFPNGTGEPLSTEFLNAHNKSGTTKSRNPLIDDIVEPGPYMEMLPCDDLCHALIRNCPASLGFSCPSYGRYGLDVSYARRSSNKDDSCNFPGSVHLVRSVGLALSLPSLRWSGLLALTSFLLML